MTVVHIAKPYGETNNGGAALSAVRLHMMLLKHGVDSHFICVYDRESSDSPDSSTFHHYNVHELPRGIWRNLYMLLTKISRCMWKFTGYRRSIPINVIPMFGLEKELKKIKPDVVHIHEINGDICTYEQIARLPYRVVFNLHDLFMLCGFAVHPGDDPRFEQGFTAANSPRLERWLFNRKRRLIETKKPTFIADSRWVESICRRSLIGRNFPVRTIYNLPDAIFLFPAPTPSHEAQDTKHKTFKLLFGCFGGLTNHFKGFPDLLKAFELLAPEERGRIVLQVFGTEELVDTEAAKCEKLGIRMENLGIPSNEDLLGYYRSSDIFVFPSVKETIGMTKVEALLCGLPVVAFDRTACAEGIVHGETGWIAPDGDYCSYSEGIRHFMNHPVDRAAIFASTANLFSAKSIVSAVVEVYTHS